MSSLKFKVFVISFLITVIAIPAVYSDSGIFIGNSLVNSMPMPTPADRPPYSAYKGVTIGTSMDEARAKLGSPRDKSNDQDLYVFSDNESAQVYYDASKTVNAVTVTYTGKLSAVPDPKAVFGIDVTPKPDGGIFKMVRYPEAGYWISYNKIVGDDPIIMIAMKKI